MQRAWLASIRAMAGDMGGVLLMAAWCHWTSIRHGTGKATLIESVTTL